MRESIIQLKSYSKIMCCSIKTQFEKSEIKQVGYRYRVGNNIEKKIHIYIKYIPLDNWVTLMKGSV